jgi:hypothetical protein
MGGNSCPNVVVHMPVVDETPSEIESGSDRWSGVYSGLESGAKGCVVVCLRGAVSMTYWVHIARSIDRVTLHKDRCSEVPSTSIGSSTDFWEGGWFDYPNKDRALAAMEQAGTNEQRRCPLCKA